jgi:hypothetical protein
MRMTAQHVNDGLPLLGRELPPSDLGNYFVAQ